MWLYCYVLDDSNSSRLFKSTEKLSLNSEIYFHKFCKIRILYCMQQPTCRDFSKGHDHEIYWEKFSIVSTDGRTPTRVGYLQA